MPDALTAWIAAAPPPKPLFVGLAAGHAATRTMSIDAAVAKLRDLGVAAYVDPAALVKAAARSLT